MLPARLLRDGVVALACLLLVPAATAQVVGATIAAGTTPTAVAVNPLKNKIYVANYDSGDVTIIDGNTNTTKTVATGARASWVAVNPETGTAYVGNVTTGTTSLIDGTTDTVYKTLNVVVPGPFTINVHGDRVYQNRAGTADETNIITISTDQYLFTSAILSYAPSSLVFDPVANRLHVGTLASSDVVNMDMTGDPEYATSRYCPDGNGGMQPIDPNNRNPPTCSDVPGAPVALAVNPLTGRVYSLSNSGEISVIVKPFYSFTAFTPAGGPYTGAAAIAVNPVTNKVYAAYANAIVVMDGATNAMTVLAGGGVGIGIDVNTNKIYVAGSTGTLTVIDGDTNVTTSVPIPTGAKGIAVNPITHKAYVIADQVTVVSGNASDVVHSVPLNTSITAMPNDVAPATGSFSVAANSTMAAAPLDTIRAIYYQLDVSAGGPWTRLAGRGSFTIPYANLSPGQHTLRVVAANGLEAPNINTDHASVPILGNLASYVFTVLPPQSSTVTFTSSANPSAAGQSVTFTANVTGGGAQPTGTVAFSIDTFVLTGCEAVALVNGSANCTTSHIPAPGGQIFVEYSGDTTYAGTATIGTQSVTGTVLPPKRSRQNYNGDAFADITWQHADGSSAVWLMSNGTQQSGARLVGPGTGWSPVLVGDFNGDGKADILWQNVDGSSALWLMNGTTQIGGGRLFGAGTGWSAKLVVDLDGDGKSDIIWQHTDGRVAAWMMNGFTQVGGSVLIAAGSGYTPKLAADFNGDGKGDLVFVHTDGRVAIWIMNGMTQVGGGVVLPAGTGYVPLFTADLDGDGRADLFWQHSNGAAAVWLMNGASQVGGARLLDAGSPWTLQLAGDLSGDGRADLVLRNADGSTSAWLMDSITKVGASVVQGPASGFTARRVADTRGKGIGDILMTHADGRTRMVTFSGAYLTDTDLIPAGTGWTLNPLQD